MLRCEEKIICHRAIETFGKSSQMVVAIEECSELQKELTKTLRGKPNLFNLSEEIADVEIMIEQLKIIFNNADEVESIKETKFQRLNRTIKKVNKTEIL